MRSSRKDTLAVECRVLETKDRLAVQAVVCVAQVDSEEGPVAALVAWVDDQIMGPFKKDVQDQPVSQLVPIKQLQLPQRLVIQIILNKHKNWNTTEKE
jgi:hypothetical protein